MADGGRSAGHRNGGVVIAVYFICLNVPLALASNCYWCIFPPPLLTIASLTLVLFCGVV